MCQKRGSCFVMLCVSGWYKGKVARGKLLLFLVELYFVAVVRVELQ